MLAGPHEKPLKFLIVGAGAVGGFVAARLADAGYNVTLLVRPGRAARLRDEGLRIASQDRERQQVARAVGKSGLSRLGPAVIGR